MNILSLCDLSRVMVKPWAEAGHNCIAVDIAYAYDFDDSQGIKCLKRDLYTWIPCEQYDVVFAFPPCTDLALSGALHWERKGEERFQQALELVFRCWDICKRAKVFWMLENPVGRLSTSWRKPDHYFDPYDYGDPYKKHTCLWTGGFFHMPVPDPVVPTEGSKVLAFPKTRDRARLRSVTPSGFAEAVFQANKDLFSWAITE